MSHIETIPTVPPGSGVATSLFQEALDRLRDAGGGTLVVPPGTWTLGVVRLHSDTRVQFEPGARIVASGDYADYAAHPTRSTAELSRAALFFASGARNVSIVGPGAIDGNAGAYFAPVADEHGYRLPDTYRPRIVVFEDCEDVTIADIVIRQAPMWTIHLVASRRVTVTGVTVDNDLGMSNTDALNIDGCSVVHVSNCDLSAADDGICIKTTRKPDGLERPARYITIVNCTLRSTSCALKIGTETADDIEWVTVSNCIVYESNRAIGIFSRDGGNVRRISFQNIAFDCRLAPVAFWGKADPVFISARTRDPAVPAGEISDISFTGLSGRAEGAINVHSETPGLVRGISFSDVAMEQRESTSPLQGLFDLRPPVNRLNPTGMGLDNAHAVEADGSSWGVESYPGGLPGVFTANVPDVRLSGVRIDRPRAFPSGWNPQEVVVSTTVEA